MLKNSENYNNQENLISADHETQSSKKFVFQLHSENKDFIERLTYQQKNDLVNYLIHNYRLTSYNDQMLKKNINAAKKAAIIFLAIVVGIPLIIYVASISLSLTKSSYVDMQKNFEKLF